MSAAHDELQFRRLLSDLVGRARSARRGHEHDQGLARRHGAGMTGGRAGRPQQGGLRPPDIEPTAGEDGRYLDVVLRCLPERTGNEGRARIRPQAEGGQRAAAVSGMHGEQFRRLESFDVDDLQRVATLQVDDTQAAASHAVSFASVVMATESRLVRSGDGRCANRHEQAPRFNRLWRWVPARRGRPPSSHPAP
jgi:hypothetical protein